MKCLSFFEAVLDATSPTIPPNHPLDHVDERLPVHLLIVGVISGYVGVIRLEHHRSGGVNVSVLCFLLTLFDLLFALDVTEQPRERHPLARFAIHVLELSLAAQLRPDC